MEGEFTNPTSSRGRILLALIRYLIRHPDAKDTSEGIRRWWHNEDEPEWLAEDLEAVLKFLVERNWAVMREAPAGKLFGAGAASLEEMQRFLEEYAREEKE